MWDNLEQFTKWYIDNNYPFRPPAGEPVYVTDYTHSTIIFREDRYQVELYLMSPNWETPSHSHPGVEHKIIFINGTISGTRNGKIVDDSSIWHNLAKEDGTCVIMGNYTDFDPEDWHSVKLGDKGGFVLVTQKWEEGLKMTSQSVHYVGEPIGPEHEKYIDKDIKV